MPISSKPQNDERLQRAIACFTTLGNEQESAILFAYTAIGSDIATDDFHSHIQPSHIAMKETILSTIISLPRLSHRTSMFIYQNPTQKGLSQNSHEGILQPPFHPEMSRCIMNNFIKLRSRACKRRMLYNVASR